MRYFIKAYPMHETEQGHCSDVVNEGAIENAEIEEGLLRGIADEATIKRLADSGIVVQAIAKAPEPGEGGLAADDADDQGGAGPGVTTLDVGLGGEDELETFGVGGPPPPAHEGYVLAELLAGVSDNTVATLAAAGAEIVERDPSGMYVLHVAADVDTDRLRRLPFVGQVRNYGARETVEGAATALDEDIEALGLDVTESLGVTRAALPRSPLRERPVGLFEAILHRSEDVGLVAAQLEGMGVKVVARSTRSLRFVPAGADLQHIAELPGIASVAKTQPPRRFHDLARPLVGLAPQPAPGGAAPPPFPYDGTGEIVGVADTGIDTAHPDFAGRIVGTAALGRPPANVSDPDGHGTHVAGSAVGSGAASNGQLAGVATGAQLYFQSVLDANGTLGGLPDPITGLFQQAYDAGVRIHNNSWGAYVQGRYETMALDLDEFVCNHPDFLAVIAAGNQGSCTKLNAAEGFVDFPSLGSPASAKNGLTVGASRTTRKSGGLSTLKYKVAWPKDFPQPPIGEENVSGDDQGIAAFSSRGPCDETRIKPDVVAPGTDIASTRSQLAPLAHFWGAYPNNARYAFMGGTSMACPIVAGCATLVRQYYRQQRNHADPSAALIKATLINGTTPLTGADATAPIAGFPNYHQGFGRVNMGTTLPAPTNPAFELFFADSWNRDPALRFTQRKGRRRWRITLAAAGEIRACIAWHDPPGRGLQNALRIILDDGASNKWIGNETAATPIRIPLSDPRKTLPGFNRVVFRDPNNNVQMVRAKVPAGTYTLALFPDTLLRLPQDFALVVTGPDGTVVQEVQ